jgi:hypothetical protein
MSACAKGLSNPEGGPNVVDDRCGTVNSVVAGVGEQLHDGRVYPYFAGDRNRCGVDQNHSGTKTVVNDLRILIPRSYTLHQMIAHLKTGGEN